MFGDVRLHPFAVPGRQDGNDDITAMGDTVWFIRWMSIGRSLDTPIVGTLQLMW
jgi:hypothetical protein